ncbi:MAG TPA: glycosyl hydrolase family 28-related protein, partial [bacterium]|nr:glycosyl hydrolase family 28-related protein [bacterium]
MVVRRSGTARLAILSSILFFCGSAIGVVCAQDILSTESKTLARWIVTDFGAVGDGKTDSTRAIQNALDAAGENGGGEVFLPVGNYVLESSVRIPSGVTLQGIWNAPHHSTITLGSALWIKHGKNQEDGPAAIDLSPSSALRGVTIYYPEQSPDKIIPYSYAIHGRGMNPTVENVTFINVYQGIDFGSKAHELHTIRYLYGCVLRRGIYINQCTDIGRIENVHFNPHYWARANVPEIKIKEGQPGAWDNLVNYLNENLEVFIFGRTDWEYVFNTFAWGFNVCYRFTKTEQGSCNGSFIGCGADGGKTCVLIEDSQKYTGGLLFTNGEFVAMRGDNPVMIRTTNEFAGAAQFSNCSFWGPCAENVVIEGTGQVSLSQCNFVQWAFIGDKTNQYSVRHLGGTLMMTA